MKKKYSIIKLMMLSLVFFSACNEDILDKSPLNSYSDPLVWSNIDLASTYLTRVYQQLDYSLSRHQKKGNMTDEVTIAKGGTSNVYNQGTITASNTGTDIGQLSWNHFSNIQRINLFLENIDRVANSYSDAEKPKIEARAKVLKGEALFLRAWEYHTIMFSYGGVPLMEKPFTLNEDFNGITRATFKETVDFIVKDCDDAASLLKLKSEMEMGRATKESALALKSRVLLFAASDLTADGTAKSELVGYANPNRTALWTAARDAAKAVMDLGTAKLADFGAPNKKLVAEKYFAMFKAYDLSDNEVIWGRMFRQDVGSRHTINRSAGPNGNSNYGNTCPLQAFVDSYEMEDGSKFFDHFTLNENKEYKNISTKFRNENPYYNREPRFYASILFDSAVWQPRFSNLSDIDPVGIYDRRTRKVIENGVVISERYGLDTRQGPVDNWNGSYSGYVLKKLLDDKCIGRDEYNQNIWIYLRFVEVIFNYAEACLELGDETNAAKYINMVRNRAGLPNFTGDITAALRHERKIEMFMEDIRWYDIRRWKILIDVLNTPPGGIDIMEVVNDGVKTTTWKWISAQPVNKPNEKLYWLPIAADELKRAPQLQQNPGY